MEQMRKLGLTTERTHRSWVYGDPKLLQVLEQRAKQHQLRQLRTNRSLDGPNSAVSNRSDKHGIITEY